MRQKEKPEECKPMKAKTEQCFKKKLINSAECCWGIGGDDNKPIH